jgi:RNA polymerase sigma-70 factor (ECF subfamily)
VTIAEKIVPRDDGMWSESRQIGGARRRSLDCLAAQYHDSLIAFFRQRTGSREEACDLTQDAFVKLSSIDLDRVQAPGAFLFAIARNLLRDRARSRAARDAALNVSEVENSLVCPRAHPERTLAGREQLRVLEAALRELPPKCRAVLVLYRFDELSQRAIANQLGISVPMVEKYLKRAQDHCRRRLEDANDHPRSAPARTR